MGYDRLEPGFLDRVFNSTIGLPQQALWRIWRAMEDDEIDLFSEKGLMDGALIPGLGVFDDHKEDVMPDYMAEQMGLADENKSGLGSQLAAAILSDPLTYMTGGLSAIGKVGKAATLAKRSPAMGKVLREAAEEADMSLDDMMRAMSPEDFMAHIDTAITQTSKQSGRQATRQTRHLSQMKEQMGGAAAAAAGKHERDFYRAGNQGPLAPQNLKIADAVKQTRDRQISIGLPIFHRWGAKVDVFDGYSSWWKLHKDGVNKGGTQLAKSLHLNKLVDLPGVGTILASTLKNVVAPVRHLRGGWQVGHEARVALKQGDSLLPDEAQQFAKWLSPEGAAPVAHDVHKAADKLGGRDKVLEHLKVTYEEGIVARNLTHEEAFKAAMRSVGIGSKGESGAQLFGRLTGRTNDNTYFPKWGAGASKGKAAFDDIVDNLIKKHEKASKLNQQGRASLAPVYTKNDKLTKMYEAERETELLPGFATIAEGAFKTGKAAKAVVNKVFHTGNSSRAGEQAYGTFLANVARDNDQLELLTQGLYKKLGKLTEAKGAKLSKRDVTKLVSKLIELDALPGEIAASFRVADMNPTQMNRVLLSMDNFMKRQRQSLTSIEKLLKKGGIADKETRKKLLDVFETEVFPFMERKGSGSTPGQQLMGIFGRIIKSETKVVEEFTPHQQTLLKRVNNKHVVTSVDLPLSSAQSRAVAQGKEARQKKLLEQWEGRNAGTLDDNEIAEALLQLDEAGQRLLTQDEVLKAAEEMPAIQQLIARHRNQGNYITTAELLTAMSKSGRTDTRLVPRSVTEEIPLWGAGRTRWTHEQAQAQAQQWGFDIVQNEWVDAAGKVKPGTFRFEPRSLGTTEMTQFQMRGILPGMPIPPAGGFHTYGEAMEAMREMLKRNPDYMRKSGPGMRTVNRPLRIASTDIANVRKLLKDSPDDLAILAGKGKRFDEAALPTGALPHLDRLRKLQARRALPKDHRLYDSVITPTTRRVTTRVAPPRSSDEFAAYLEKEGGLVVAEGELGEWALNYTRGRLLMREVQNALKRAHRTKQPVEIDPRIMADIEAHVTATGATIRNIMESHLPKEFTEMMDLSRKISAHSFEAAKRAGVWMPGSPVAYLPRFFNKAARSRIASLMGDMELNDGGILARLGIRQAQYFKRQWDEMSVDDLNEVYFELRDAMTQKGASPKLREFHTRLDKEMQKSGIGISGLNKALPWMKNERIENDPFLALMQRFGVAQQDKNLEHYFNNMLSAAKGDNGESLMLGGKVVGIVDDTGNVQRLDRPSYKARSVKKGKTKGRGTAADREDHFETWHDYETISLSEGTATDEFVPKSLMIELEDGTVHTFENNMLMETGFGILNLGKQGTEAEQGFKATIGNSFARASMRSDLHNQMIQAPMSNSQALQLMGKNVVFGSQNNIVGMVKSAAQVHKVTAPALRTFDAINFGIKSFQTIFRLPFHVANLSSGVFQAHLAGATPKNLMASYWDTMRFMFGDQEFAKRASMVTDMLDLGSDAHSLGFVNLLKGDKSLIQQATRAHGGGDLAAHLAKADPDVVSKLDQFEDLVIPLSDGTELNMMEFIQTAGEMQLYGTFASSMTRGSRSVGDNLVRIKMETLEPSFGGRILGAPKRLLKRMANAAETSEVINRTSTALALVREGHPMHRAIEIAKEAHVPYEKLTPFERNAMKRFSVYYTFPRHYMPWAWARFAEDPQKLAGISHFIRDQNVVSTQEGKPNLVLGDYRLDLGRLNANMEAAGMVAALADRVVMPAAEAMAPGVDAYDTRKLRSRYSDAGLTNIGGVASVFLGRNLLPDPQRDMPGKGLFEEASTLVWPLKFISQMMGKTPSKAETSPYVQYTKFEEWLTSTVAGPGTRKVRDEHELVRTNMAYRRILKQLQMRAAATDDKAKRDSLLSHAREMSMGLRQIANESRQQKWK